ncbi:MAG: hypothetical protein JXA77_01680 [Bacteroidales bacterium]|nr:hypothetical protein [Bacteroidales bacterium]MBN2820153.1 hypothetical protein [Bacteroidales bacterium]
MRHFGIITGLIFLFLLNVNGQQNAEDIFHFAGNLFINGNYKGAKAEIENGLKLFPGDSKLQALRDKIKEQEKKQQEQNQQNQDQNNEEKDKQNQKQEDNQQADNSDQEQNQQQPQPKDGEQEEQQQQQQQQQYVEGEISKEDAERILNALEEEEKDVLKKLELEKAKSKKVPTEKEW